MGLTKAQRAARKAWKTRRKQNPEKYGKKVVGFYKDGKKRTRPITKSTQELKQKKIIKKPRKFKGVKPQRTKSKAEQLRTIMERKKPSKRGTGLKKTESVKRHPKLKQTQDVRVYRQPALRTWRYQSKSSPDKYYTVRLNEDETLSCNCPGWIFSKKPKSCRHTREVHTKHKVG